MEAYLFLKKMWRYAKRLHTYIVILRPKLQKNEVKAYYLHKNEYLCSRIAEQTKIEQAR